jgi:hypothetical protein
MSQSSIQFHLNMRPHRRTLSGEPAAENVQFYVARSGMPQGEFIFADNVNWNKAHTFACAVADLIDSINKAHS